MATTSITPGRVLLTLTGLVTVIGPYVADWSNSHVFNPRWPPHAKFHNGQTMSMGAGLGLLTLYYTWRHSPATSQDSILTATILGSLYYITAFSAVLYPGSKAVDPEFGEGFPQKYVFGTFLASALCGGFLESRRLAGLALKQR